jgi:hypothetical protein
VEENDEFVWKSESYRKGRKTGGALYFLVGMEFGEEINICQTLSRTRLVLSPVPVIRIKDEVLLLCLFLYSEYNTLDIRNYSTSVHL